MESSATKHLSAVKDQERVPITITIVITTTITAITTITHLIHARWHSSVSVLAAMTWQSIASNSLKRSENAMISAGR
jgi:hypothetical protein